MKMKCSVCLLFCLFAGLQKAHASSANASSYGYNATDASTALWNAINDGSKDTIIVDFVGAGKWVTDVVYVFRDNLTLIFEPGVVVEAKPGLGCVSLFMLNSRENISMWGYGATIQMLKGEYEASHPSDNCQFRNCIGINGGKNINIYGLTLRDSGGDGLYLGQGTQGFMPDCEDIHVKDCVMDNNFRQGISIATAVNVLIENCDIKNTRNSHNTFPESGIDIEPNYNWSRLENLTIRNCRITGNNRWGLLLYFFPQDTSTLPFSINIEDTYIANNGVDRMDYSSDEGGGLRVQVVPNGRPTGVINFKNCLVEDELGPGLRVLNNAGDLQVNLDNCVFRNVMSKFSLAFENPIWIEGSFTAGYGTSFRGGVHFGDCLLLDLKNRMAVRYVELYDPGNLGAKDITGNLAVVNPFGATVSWGNNPVNATLNIDAYATLPASGVSLYSSDIAAAEGFGNTANFVVQRNSANLGFPLPVLLNDFAGTATGADDYCFQNKLAIIRANSATDTTIIIGRADGLAEPLESLVPGIAPDGFYSIANPSSATLYIGDLEGDVEDADNDGFLVFQECDDGNGSINPDAVELPNNGLDDDCDGYDRIVVKAKVYLQGVYSPAADAMQLPSYPSAPLPLAEPYNMPPWNHYSLDNISGVPGGMIDWVLVQLLDTASFALLSSKAALLLGDGRVVDALWAQDSTVQGVTFDLPPGLAYHLVIRHRNHLAVMSANAVNYAYVMPYDFTDAANVMGANQVADMGNGKFALFAGDFDGNGLISANDFGGFVSQASFLHQYLPGDFNLDGAVTVSDYNLLKANLGIGAVQQVRY